MFNSKKDIVHHFIPISIFINMLALLAFVFFTAGPVLANDNHDNDERVCSKTAKFVFKACRHDIKDDYMTEKANCLNIVDDEARSECFFDAKAEKRENAELCADQLEARRELCEVIGEAPYDVSEFWNASNFVNPLEIGTSVTANPYFSLVPGTTVYEGGDEFITVTVTTDTKLVNGVTCVVVTDVVQVDGKDVEDTDDWFAQDVAGNVWYCGEVSKNFEFFAGDNPQVSELVDLEGSWKAFRDHAMPGITMQANPQIGDVYRQEMLLSDAEDVAEVLDNAASGMLEGDNCTEGGATIAAFVELMCNGDCLVTKDFTPISPGVIEHKYYAPGVGFILETDPEGECVVPEGVL